MEEEIKTKDGELQAKEDQIKAMQRELRAAKAAMAAIKKPNEVSSVYLLSIDLIA